MIRRLLMCRRVVKHVLGTESLQVHSFTKALSVTVFKRLCHHQTPTDNAQAARVLEPAPLSKDVFLEEIKGLSSLEDMVTSIEQNREQVSTSHLSLIFRKLGETTKGDSSFVGEILTSRPFAVLCQHALKHIRQFSKVETVYLIKTLCSLNVPLESNLGQASLQMLRHYINSLSLNHIAMMDTVLRSQPSNPLLDALKKALPLSLEIQIAYQLDPNDLWQVSNCLSVATSHNLDSSIIENLASIVHHKAETMSTAKTLSVLTSLSHIKRLPQNLKPTVKELLNRLNYLIMDLSKEETQHLIMLLQCKHFFHSKLFSSLSHRCCTEGWDLQAATRLLSVFNYHKFLSSSMLGWVLECLEKDPTLLSEDDRISLLTVCEAFSEANHNVNREQFTSLIRNCERKLTQLETESPEFLVKLAMHLAILECIPLELMERVFCAEFISRAMKRVQEKDQVPSLLQCYLTLEQSARLDLQSNYEGPFLPPELLKEAIAARAKVMKPIDLVLQQFLEVGLGGSQFMLNGLWTRLGHFIDHLVVMRKEDFPVQLNSEQSLTAERDAEGFAFVEDVVLPENAKILAVLVARREWFNRDPPRLRGWMSFQQKILAKMGYNPVIIGPPVENADKIQDIDCRLESESCC